MAKATKAAAKKIAGKKSAARHQDDPRSMPKAGKDPKGGLTAKGREFFNKTEGSHLRPGVKGPADTPEKMLRKGSFLRRHFTHPRGPMVNDKGEPTRLALSAQAWGEPLPKSKAAAKKLAAKGHQLLERYHAAKDEDAGGRSSARKFTKKARGAGGGKKTAKKATAKKTNNPKKTAKKATKKTSKKAAKQSSGS